jgi:hypothetical protein
VGETLGLAGRTIVAGAAGDDVGGRAEQGSMYVYVKPPAGWATAEQTSRLVRGNGLAGEAFGTVAMAGDTIVSGASGASASAGAAFVFLDDRVSPETTIDSGPSGPTNDNTPAFTFSANEPGSTFRCTVDGGPSTRCASPLEIAPALADGHHTFAVAAVDRAGNRDQSAAPAEFMVDTSTPDTTITAGPSGPTNAGAPVFEFTSAEAGATFACRIDAGAFAPCTSPFTAPPLGDGPHTFDVHAQDAAGNVDLSDASRAFTVDATAPETAITAGPAGPTNVSAPTFTFGASEAAAFACRVDAAAFAPCSSPVTIARLPDGPHVFEVVATDAVGNTDASAASRGFSVDTVAPDTTLASGPRGRITDRNPTFRFTSEPGATFRCRVDRRAFAPCSSRHTTDDLRLGRHTFAVAAVDAAGNVDATPAARRIQVLALIAGAAFSYETDRAPSGRTVFTKLRVFELDRRAKLTVACKGRGCPFARKRVRIRRSSVDLRPLVRNGLRRGTRLTITVARRNRTSMVLRLKVRAGGRVGFTRRCRAPGARRTRPCAQLRP